MEINNNIQESRCSLELSKLLKIKGFSMSFPCVCFIKSSANPNGYESTTIYEADDKFHHIKRPTHALAIDWLMLNFGFYVFSDPVYDFSSWTPRIVKKGDLNHHGYYKGILEFPSSSEALEAGLIHILKKLK